MSQESEIVKFGNGKVSSKIPRLELIPRQALSDLALRFERGVRIKGDGAWNALTDPAAADDKQFVIDRLAHCIDHCYKAIDAINHNLPMKDLQDGGDAGAIMFAGALLSCHVGRNRVHGSKV